MSPSDGTVSGFGLNHNELNHYQVKHVEFLELVNFGIIFSESADVDSTVMLVRGNYLTIQPTGLAFSPVGPKEAARHDPRGNFPST